MIDEYWTFKLYGYISEQLSPHSHKEIVVVCEECGQYRVSRMQQYRDLCKSCAKSLSNKERTYKPHSEERKRCMSEIMKNRPWTEEHRENHRKAVVGSTLTFSEEHKQKISDAAKKRTGDKNSNWRGGSSYEPYCYKFNAQFKEAIRTKFGRKCFMCGLPEEDNYSKLSVHHVSYNSKCQCDGTSCEFVPLCYSCHGRTHYSRESWERLIRNVLYYEQWI
jgi:hypothetical protein